MRKFVGRKGSCENENLQICDDANIAKKSLNWMHSNESK